MIAIVIDQVVGTGPTREMIAAGAWKLRELRQWGASDDVLVESVWFAMDEARTRREQTGTGYISPSTS